MTTREVSLQNAPLLLTDIAIKAGVIGATVGVTGAAAASIRKVQNGQATVEEAIRDVFVAGGKVGLATGVSAVAGAIAGRNGLGRVAATLAVGTLLMYALTSKRTHARLKATCDADGLAVGAGHDK